MSTGRGFLVAAVLSAVLSNQAPAASPAFQQAVANSTPLLYYKLNEASGAAINYGSLGAAFNATYFGTIQRDVSTAIGGDSGVLFDGDDDYLESGAVAPAGLTGNPTFTAEALVVARCNGAVGFYAPFLHWGSGGTGQEVYFSYRGNSADRVYCGFYNGGQMTNVNVPIGAWMHVVWVRQGGGNAGVGTTLYINGQPIATANDNGLCCGGLVPNVNATEFRVNRGRDLVRYFTGILDEVALYDRALSAGEVAAHYAALTLPSSLKGDLNCDNYVNGFDVDGFVTALLDPADYAVRFPGCNPLNGDFNASTSLTTADISPFVLRLLSGANSPYQQAVMADAPRLYYTFDEGTTVAANHGSLGSAYHAYYNQHTASIPSAAGDRAIFVTGANSFLVTAASAPAAFTGNPSFSAEALIMPTCAAVNYPAILNWGTPVTGREVFFGFRGNRTDQVFTGFFAAGIAMNGSILPAQWVHVVWTRQGGGDASTGSTLYVNGQPVALTPDPILCCNMSIPDVAASPFRINLTADGVRNFVGGIDEVALYDTVLTPVQVLAHYNALPN